MKGRYDDICERILVETEAHTVLLIVLGGNKGHGFSVCTLNQHMTQQLPQFLRGVAQNIEEINNDAKKEENE